MAKSYHASLDEGKRGGQAEEMRFFAAALPRILVLGALVSGGMMGSKLARASSLVETPLLAYTHLLPSPFTLPGGRFVLGTDVALGITDFLQVGSNILLDAYKIYNVNAKLALLDYEGFALALTGGYESYNLHDQDSGNPDLQIKSFLPGAVAGFSISPTLAAFVGGNLNFTSQALTTNGIATSGYSRGASAETDLSWAYNPHKKGIGNVLSGGLSYDFTYQLVGVGLSHYWRGFHLGVHYYPNATQNKFLPIIAGGAVVDL
jgi:hypothetical protein